MFSTCYVSQRSNTYRVLCADASPPARVSSGGMKQSSMKTFQTYSCAQCPNPSVFALCRRVYWSLCSLIVGRYSPIRSGHRLPNVACSGSHIRVHAVRRYGCCVRCRGFLRKAHLEGSRSWTTRHAEIPLRLMVGQRFSQETKE